MGFSIKLPSFSSTPIGAALGGVTDAWKGIGNAASKLPQAKFIQGGGFAPAIGKFVGGGGLLGLAGRGGAEEPASATSGIPDFTNQYEQLAQDLNTKQKAADAQNLQLTSGANLASQRSNLAMRGGLTAGANERLAESSQDAFANAYGDLATKYGLGSAQIGVDAIKTRQEMELAKAMGADRVNALKQTNKSGLAGLPIIGGLFS